MVWRRVLNARVKSTVVDDAREFKKMQLQSNANDDAPIANHLPLAIVDDVIVQH